MVKDEILHAAVDMDDTSNKHDRLRDALIQFVEEKEDPLAEVVAAHKKAVEAAGNVVTFFGEETNSDPITFFKTVSSFLSFFKKAVEAMLAEAERKKASERQTRQRARSKSMITTVTCPLKNAGSSPDLVKVAAEGCIVEKAVSDESAPEPAPPVGDRQANGQNEAEKQGSNGDGGNGEVDVARTDAAAEAAEEEEDAQLVEHLRHAIDARPWIRSKR